MKEFLRKLISAVLYILLSVVTIIGLVSVLIICDSIVGGILNFVKDLFFSIVSRRVFYGGIFLFIATSLGLWVIFGIIEFIGKYLKRK